MSEPDGRLAAAGGGAAGAARGDARERLEAAEDPEEAIDVLHELAEIAKEVEAELERAQRDGRCVSADELRELVEGYLARARADAGAGALDEPMRYASGGGKRVRPVLASRRRGGGREPEPLLPAAAAVELVHSFSLVHDDLPALDDDDERRGRRASTPPTARRPPSSRATRCSREAFRLALSYPTPGRRARARRRDARDDRRPAARPHRAATTTSRELHRAEDRRALRGRR